MLLNETIDAAKPRWQAWMDGALAKGPILAVTAPLDTPRQAPLPLTQPKDIRSQWIDPHYRLTNAHNSIMATWYGGDAIPNWFVNLGPGAVAAYLGGPVEFHERTVWFGQHPAGTLENILPALHYDDQNWYWQLTLDLTRRAIEQAQGQYYVSFTDLGGDLDILASLRGTENLLADMLDAPDAVRACQQRICEHWLRYFKELTAVIKAGGQDGFTCWLPCYSKRPWYSLQCDLSVMFSQSMFRQFETPLLGQQAAAMGNAVYHWDGPGELQHLDSLVSVPGINALEYVAVPTDPPNTDLHYLPYYRRVAEAGRGVLLRTGDPQRAYKLVQNMPAERLAIVLSAKSVKEAQDWIKRFGATE